VAEHRRAADREAGKVRGGEEEDFVEVDHGFSFWHGSQVLRSVEYS
jgi:hypothetical protein